MAAHEDELIRNLSVDMATVKTALLGSNGQGGFIRQHTEDIRVINERMDDMEAVGLSNVQALTALIDRNRVSIEDDRKDIQRNSRAIARMKGLLGGGGLLTGVGVGLWQWLQRM